MDGSLAPELFLHKRKKTVSHLMAVYLALHLAKSFLGGGGIVYPLFPGDIIPQIQESSMRWMEACSLGDFLESCWKLWRGCCWCRLSCLVLSVEALSSILVIVFLDSVVLPNSQ